MTEPAKTLVILTPGFAKNEADSSCLPLQQQLVIKIKERNPRLEVLVLTFQYPFQTKPYHWNGNRVIPFNGQDKGGLRRLLLRKKILSTLKKIHRQRPVSALLSFWYGECAAVGKLFGDRHNLKHLCWILGQDAREKNKYPGRVKLKANDLIALSDSLRAELEKNHGQRPAHLVPAGINTALFPTLPLAKDIDILGVGSLIPLKRYDIFIEVAAAVQKKIPSLRVVLTGKGPEKEKIAQQLNSTGLGSIVEMTGHLPYAEVLALMQRAKILLHPSSYEGFPGVCLEALYAGAQVISFCRPMHAPIENWHVVGDKNEMIKKTLSILRSGGSGFRNVLFASIDDVAGQMESLLFESRQC